MYSTVVLKNKDKEGRGTVYVQYSRGANEIKRIPTGVKVQEEYFDRAGQKLRKGATINTVADNATIQAVQANVDNIIRLHIQNKGDYPTVKYLEQEYAKLNDTAPAPEKSFMEYIADFIAFKKGLNRKGSTVKGYTNLRDNLNEYEDYQRVKLGLQDVVTYEFFERYTGFLIKEKRYINSTVSKRLGVLRGILNYYTDKGINNNVKYKGFKFENKTAKNQEVITVSVQELKLLNALDLTGKPRLDRVRDWFILECWTGLRYVDLMATTSHDFKSGYVKRYIEKTDEFIKIPIFAEAKRVLEKNNYELKRYSNHKYNQYLKELFGLVPGMNEEITKVRFNGNTKVKETRTKANWMASHAARRTFITLLLDTDVKPAQIMLWSGHTSFKSFQTYINKRQGEAAAIDIVNNMF